MAATNYPSQNFIHHNRSVTVNANRKGVLMALIAFACLGVFAAIYWMYASNLNEDISSPQTNVKIERPFNSSVLPRSHSTPVNQ